MLLKTHDDEHLILGLSRNLPLNCRIATHNFTHTSFITIPDKLAEKGMTENLIPSITMIGGLFNSKHSWQSYVEEYLNPELEGRGIKNKVHIRLNCLKGHEDITNPYALNTIKAEDWIHQIIKTAENDIMLGRLPILIGCSTSSIATLCAASERPDLFGGIILTGTPMGNAKPSHRLLEFALPRIMFLNQIERLIRKHTDTKLVSRDERTPEEAMKYRDGGERRGVRLHSGSAVFPFGRLLVKAYRAIRRIKCPILFLHSESDSVTTLQRLQSVVSKKCSAPFALCSFPESGHILNRGHHDDMVHMTSILADIIEQGLFTRISGGESRENYQETKS